MLFNPENPPACAITCRHTRRRSKSRGWFGQSKRAVLAASSLIDHDVAGRPLDRALFDDLSDIYLIGTSGGYGDFSHIYRILAAVDWLDDHGMQFDWLQNLSGQDYPLRPVADIEQAISVGGFDGYMQYAPVFPERTPADADWGAGPAYRLSPPFDSAMRFDYSHRRFGMPTSPQAALAASVHGGQLPAVVVQGESGLLERRAPPEDHDLQRRLHPLWGIVLLRVVRAMRSVRS